MSLLTRKSIARFQAEGQAGTLTRALGPLQLHALGIGSVSGPGPFVMPGRAAPPPRGPAPLRSMQFPPPGPRPARGPDAVRFIGWPKCPTFAGPNPGSDRTDTRPDGGRNY